MCGSVDGMTIIDLIFFWVKLPAVVMWEIASCYCGLSRACNAMMRCPVTGEYADVIFCGTCGMCPAGHRTCGPSAKESNENRP